MRDLLAYSAFLLGSSCALSTYEKSTTPRIWSDARALSRASTSLAALEDRAAPDAPNGYVPENIECPSTRPSIRQASALSPEEVAWLSIRRNATTKPMRELLNRLDITGLDVDSYMDAVSDNATDLPNIGLAFSGGGYRALLNGAGALSAFDSRTAGSSEPGHLGGLLQASTYIAGLSGGSWLVGSIFMNNFTSVQDILGSEDDDDEGAVWRFDMPITKGPEDGFSATSDYLQGIIDNVLAKREAGYNISLTDVWGRALSFQLISPVDGGVQYTFSSIANADDFRSGNTPMPIIVADGRKPDELVIDGNASVYEFNPWELGTFDPTTFAFAPLKYLGSNFSDGEIPRGGRCVRGFDNAGYIMGTSSSLFNQGLLKFQTDGGILASLVTPLLEDVDEENNDVANYPNPFRGINPLTSDIHEESSLTLVDGGSDLQNLPLHPLTQPQRKVDVIFAIDSSADTLEENGGLNWPNGTALVATFERSLLPIANKTAFPAIPDLNTFVNKGLNNRPVFFGCDVENTTSSTPLVVYIPNAPYSYFSNVSTFQMGYTHEERAEIIENGYNVATMGNATVSTQWPTCVGCAILHRSLVKTGTAIPDVCKACFQEFCWDGSLDTSEATYNPEMKLRASGKAGGKDQTSDAESWSVDLFKISAALMLVVLLEA